ncbi:single-stranded DNA-binding protein [Candidatus Pacearchaeota archaeon]|nr:single-stranded DNA-binding protein [Candidatus Pacearchaeota archaeon]
MNYFNCSGKLARNAVIKGNEKKVLLFTVAAPNDGSKRVDFIPCILFKPNEEVIELLASKGKGLEVEFQGYVSTSKVEQNGSVRYFTRVVVHSDSLTVLG